MVTLFNNVQKAETTWFQFTTFDFTTNVHPTTDFLLYEKNTKICLISSTQKSASRTTLQKKPRRHHPNKTNCLKKTWNPTTQPPPNKKQHIWKSIIFFSKKKSLPFHFCWFPRFRSWVHGSAFGVFPVNALVLHLAVTLKLGTSRDRSVKS